MAPSAIPLNTTHHQGHTIMCMQRLTHREQWINTDPDHRRKGMA